MKLSQMHFKTLREVPNEAENPKPYPPAQSGHDQENGCRRVYLHANGLENHPQDREYCKRRNGCQGSRRNLHTECAAS